MEVKVDIESGEARNESHTKTDSNSGSKWGKKKTLNKLLDGVLGFKGVAESVGPTTNPDGICRSKVEYPIQGPALKVEIGNKKGGKIKKAPKPPRAPGTPSLNAADIRLIKEISKIAIKKRERFEQIKALKKMKAARLPLSSSSSSSSSSLSLSSSCSTISAMVITILFFLLLIFQGLGGRTSSNVRSARESRGT